VLGPLLAQPAARECTVHDIDRIAFATSQMDDFVTAPPPSIADWRSWSGGLESVAVLRLGAATTAVPPLALWPPDLRDRVVFASTCVAGGARLDGTDFEPLDEAGIAEFARTIAGRVDAVAVTGVFAPLTPDHELAAAAILDRELGGAVPIVLSHEIGGTGLLERENATVLQAAMTVPALRNTDRVQDMLAEHGLGHAELFFARNDGTIVAIDYAATHPLALYGAAAAATVRGAARLAGEPDALVALTRADGTPPAICSVAAGLPRLNTGHTTIAGVPTSVRVVAQVSAGPGSTGPTFDSQAMIEAIDRAKTAPTNLPLLLGGPGAHELADALPPRLTGTVGVRCPPWAPAAAAIGVATAPVGGEAERIVALAGDAAATREAVSEVARAAAIRAGADPRYAETKLIEETPLSYLANPAVALRARAEGPPRPGAAGAVPEQSGRKPVAARFGGRNGS
jgi:Hydantoinase/oxoprolinase N-terminal region/Hydantoinase/oxoprolinase